jgi:uncharacterized membrane protein (DUF485 family)
MVKTLDDAVGPEHDGGAGRSSSLLPDASLTHLITRRRRLVALLGLPSLACYLAYLALMLGGRGALATPLGGLSVGWLLAVVMLVVPAVVCDLYTRRSTVALDPLRERIGPVTGHRPEGSAR